MSDLLRKKNNLLSRSEQIKPIQKYEEPVNKPRPQKKITKKAKTTTIRCTQETSNLLNALTTVLDTKSVDRTINLSVENYMINLTDAELKQVETIKKVYDKKR